MNFALLPPRHQLVEILTRIYQQGLTTVSGGNLSIREPNGDIWITPAGLDKGTLTPEDIICVHSDGSITGRHNPSSELPFHQLIYQARPDMTALVHAHPSALVAFSIVRKVPNTLINPQSRAICGAVGYAPYAVPGTAQLGENIAAAFAEGYLSVLLENHGIVTGGDSLLAAFQRLETLEFCARINISASALGGFLTLTDDQVALFNHQDNLLPELAPQAHTSRELELRLQICRFVQRAYERHLMISTGGTVSARIQATTFLMTPYGFDRQYITPEDVVLIQDLQRETGKIPSRAVRLHHEIYRQHPEIHAIITAQPPHATTYSIVQHQFDTRTIPESYILLREMPVTPYGIQYQHPEELAAQVSPRVPVILMQNDAVLTTGKTLLEAFDRVEVAEFSAQALLNTLSIGKLVPIDDAEIENLKRRFKLP
jgi:L-fuculose-phosphate aldolase